MRISDWSSDVCSSDLIAARTDGADRTGIPETDILAMLQTMVRQRRESITAYEQGGRLDLVEQEKEEIAIIEAFLPQQLSEAEVEAATRAAIAEVGRSEEHTSELQSLMRISYAVFGLKTQTH